MKPTSFFTVSKKIYTFLFLLLIIFSAPLIYADSAKLAYFTKGWFNYSTNQGLVSNDTRNVYVTPDGTHIYVATAGGLSVSVNSGINWKSYSPSSQGSQPSIIYSVYANSNGNVIYLGTNQGVAMSYDAGAHWVYLSLGASRNVTDIAGTADGQNAYAATDSGLFITTNYGRTWTRIAITILCNAVNSVYVTNNGQQIYAATNTGLFISRDAGVTWNLATIALSANSVYVSNDQNTIYLGTAIGLYMSKDSGRSWNLITPSQGLADYTVQSVYASNNSQTIYAATKKGLSVSYDQGKTWKNYTSTDGLGSSMVNNIYASADGSKIYAATSGGFSTQGLNLWHTVNSLSNATSATLYVTPDGQKLYVGTTDGFAISTNGGVYWQDYPRPAFVSQIVASDDGSRIYVGGRGQFFGLAISTDSGATWSNSISANACWVTDFAASKDGSQLYVLCYAGAGPGPTLIQSHDSGKTWNLPLSMSTNLNAQSSTGASRLFTNDSGQYVLCSGFISRDFGRSLSRLPSGIAGNAYGSANGQQLYAGAGSLYMSKDNGNTWTNYGSSLSGFADGVFATDDGSKIYLATTTNGGHLTGGIYMSQDGGVTWKNYTTADGLPSNNITNIRASADGTQIYALAQTS